MDIVALFYDLDKFEHSRHRSIINYFTEIVAGLIAYTYREKLPSLDLRNENFANIDGLAI